MDATLGAVEIYQDHTVGSGRLGCDEGKECN